MLDKSESQFTSDFRTFFFIKHLKIMKGKKKKVLGLSYWGEKIG